MEHLNIGEILDFVSMVSPSEEELEKSKQINAHMAVCTSCRARVRAALSVHDALVAEGRKPLAEKKAQQKQLVRESKR